jgi:plastocyanin
MFPTDLKETNVGNKLCSGSSHLQEDMKFMFRFFPGAATAAVLSGLSFPLTGFAASTNVTVGNPTDRFSPTNVTINAGDKVIWTWVAQPHSTTSGTNDVPSGLWDSTVITKLPHAFTNTFPSAGSFSYYCQVHYDKGMTGAVFVTSASLPPAIVITNPLSGAVFAAPASVTIQASATNGSGTVTNVQFLVGSTVLTNETAAPFSAATNNLAAGSYNLSAIAFDNLGVKNTNAVSISVVTPVTVFLTNSAKLSSASFQFSYPANVGLSYIVQLSTNLALTNWITLVTNVAASNPVVFVDNHTTNTPGFYRVGRLPNP